MRTLGSVVPRALATALVVVVVDLGVAQARRGGAPQLELEVEALARTAWAASAAALALGLAAQLLAGGSRAARFTVLGAIGGAYLDLVFLRWNAVLGDPHALTRCLPAAIGLALVGYLVGRALGPERDEAPPGRLGWAAAAPLLLVVAGPYLVRAPDEDPRPTRPTTTGHAIPRVLLIVVDTLRADALERVDTPALDALAAESWRFSSARAPSGWTLPSMVSLLTGVSPLVHGATERNSLVPDGVPTLAEAMAAAGYRTGAIGHNAVLSPNRRLDRGFDTYRFAIPTPPPTRSLGTLLVGLTRPHELEALDAADVNELAFRWLERHRDEDFLLWLHYYDPHLVYEPPPDLLPGAPPAGMGAAYGHEAFKQHRNGFQVLDAEQRAWVRALYDGEVAYLDRELGALFARLEELGLWEDTLVIFTSDHGEEFWEHEGLEHGHTLYDELLRVPLLVRLPGGRGERDVALPASLENLAPTVLTLCGVEHEPDALSGTTLLEADGTLAATPRVPHASVGNLYYQDRAAVLFGDGRYKYVRIDASGIEELYDLEADPEERGSLVVTRPDLLEEGRRRFDEALERAGALRERLGVTAASGALPSSELDALRHLGYAGEAAPDDDGVDE